MHWSEFASDIEAARRFVVAESEEETRESAGPGAELFSEAGIDVVTEEHLFYLLLGVRRVKNGVCRLTDENLRGTFLEGYIISLSEAQNLVEDIGAVLAFLIWEELPSKTKEGDYQTVEKGTLGGRNTLNWTPFARILREAADWLSSSAKESYAALALEDQLAAKQRDEFAVHGNDWRQEMFLSSLIGIRAALGIIAEDGEASEQARKLIFELTVLNLMRLLPYLPLEVTGWKVP